MPDRTATAEPEPSGTFTLALAGDVNFAGRTADLLAAGPDTALHEAADQLSAADLTMVNLETALTEGGAPAPKQFHFRAPATALEALAAGGVDVATMANNHAVDYGERGLADTLDAIDASPLPVVGIGRDADAAYAPWTTTVNGVSVAILAASQVHDWTIAAHTAADTEAGIASAFSPRLLDAVRAAAARYDVVVVYLHWGIEYKACPSGEQRRLADQLAEAGASAIVGTHAHLLQGAGWRGDGAYVAYGLGNYYWWRSFGNAWDDNGVLTLTFDRSSVIAAEFVASRLDARGVPQVATGEQKERIDAAWEADRQCADLAAQPPAR
jgi:poly-gamma-glutamate synthesis protein (capsule biosynthesis protein)